MKKLLLISNSTNAGEKYLEYPKPYIKDFLKDSVKNILFIPYAAADFSYDEYEEMVATQFSTIGYNIQSIHKFENPIEAVKNAEAIAVGGGNTFHLLNELQKNNLIEPIYKKVTEGMPYIGWSAGSNVASPTIKTTNDMPIIEPDSFKAFNLIPFQINPHYLDANPNGHAGETREMRISEFIYVNRDIYVAGLREGTMFRIEGENMSLLGNKSMRLFKYNQDPKEYSSDDNLNFLLK